MLRCVANMVHKGIIADACRDHTDLPKVAACKPVHMCAEDLSLPADAKYI